MTYSDLTEIINIHDRQIKSFRKWRFVPLAITILGFVFMFIKAHSILIFITLVISITGYILRILLSKRLKKQHLFVQKLIKTHSSGLSKKEISQLNNQMNAVGKK